MTLSWLFFQGKAGAPGPRGLKGEKVRLGLDVRDTREGGRGEVAQGSEWGRSQAIN